MSAAESASRRGFWVLAPAFLLFWAALVQYAAPAMFGDTSIGLQCSLMVPGVALTALALAWEGFQRLGEARARWRPGAAVTGFERAGEVSDDPPEEFAPTPGTPPPALAPEPESVSAPRPKRSRKAEDEPAPARREFVWLNPGLHVAFPAWRLDWVTRDGMAGVVPVPEFARGVTLGREAECDIVVDLPVVSGHHLGLEAHGEGVEVMDLGSSNGTWVDREEDGEEVGEFRRLETRRPVMLQEGDRVRLADPWEIELELVETGR